MDGIRYGIENYYGKAIIYLDDPVFSRAWYIKSISRTGKFDWTSDPLYARQFTVKTAMKHAESLKNGADTEWEWFHNEWKNYYESIKH